jgi:DNA invertase Pin-like site-specific DNA recombinase
MSEYIYKPPKSLPCGSVVIAYMRDSGGPNQEESIGQQDRAIKAYCKEYGLILNKIYADTGTGRKVKNRDEFMQMINDVMTTHEDLRPDGLILWAYSRFSRDIYDFNYFLYGLLRQGLTVHSLTEEIPEGLAGGVLLSVKAYSSADFSEQLSKNIKRGIADRVKSGYNNGGQAPRGYRVVREEVENKRQNGLKRVGIKWEPDPELAPLVALAWELRAQGKGYAEITNATGGKVYATRNSWTSHFRNKSYLGIGKAGELEIPDHHEPLITWELWEAVQKVQDAMPRHGVRGNPTHPRRMSHPSLLSGLSFCIHCGAAMVLHTAKDYRSYRCGTRDRKRGFAACPQARGVNARIADRVILDTILYRILSPSYVESLLAEIQSEFVDTSKLDREINRVNDLLTLTERSISNLLRLAESAGDIEEIAKRLKELQQEKFEHTASLKTLQKERAIEVPDIAPEALGLIIKRWRQQIETATQSGEILSAKRNMAQFVSKIELGREKAIIHYTYPIPSDDANGLCAHRVSQHAGLFLFHRSPH